MIALAVSLTPCGLRGQGLRSISLAFDNDGFDFWVPPDQRTDWFYTHGTHLEAVLAWRAPGILGQGGDPACGTDSSATACVVTHLRLGQEIYTPERLFTYGLPGYLDDGYRLPPDRPYAGWLYGEVASERIAPGGTTRIGVQLGVTGPPSLARSAHLAFHRWLDKAKPTGWEYQIPFEPAFAVSYRSTRLWPALDPDRTVTAALEPHWTATAGTVRTAAEVGLSARLGVDAPPGLAWAGPSPRPAYLMVELGVEGEWVLRDLFLDGSTWRKSMSVAKEPLLGRARIQVSAGWSDVGLEFAVTRSTREFEGQDRAHTFGTLRVRVRR